MTSKGKADEIESDRTDLIDIVAGLVMAVISTIVLVWLIPVYVETGTSENDVGPAFFPKLGAYLVLSLSVFLTLTKVFRFKKRDSGLSGISTLIETIIWMVVATLIILGISKIGFLITSTLLIGSGAIIAGYRTWWLIILLAIFVPIIIDQMTWLIFIVDLP